jgi:hypothetical protein
LQPSDGKSVHFRRQTVDGLFSPSPLVEIPNVHPTTGEVACGANRLVTLILQKLDH